MIPPAVILSEAKDLSPVPAWFFADPLNAQAVTIEARTWLRTPFKVGMAKKGVGADCAWLAYEILATVGALDRNVSMPTYALDEGRHRLESKAVDAIRATGRFIEFPVERASSPVFLPGDVLGFDTGKTVFHLGIAITPTHFVHALQKFGVREHSIDEPIWRDKLRVIFRVTAVDVVGRLTESAGRTA